MTRECFTVKKVAQGREAVKRIKQELIPGIVSHITNRMKSFDEEIFSAFKIADHSLWDYSNADYGVAEIKAIFSPFEDSLKSHGFSIDLALFEWRALKKVVRDKYQHFTNKVAMWKQLFIHYQVQFPHILLIIELVLVTPYSSASVERGFSLMSRLLSNTRLILSNKTLDDLMALRINFPVLLSCDSKYEQKLVEKAIDMYLADKNRRTARTNSNYSASPVLDKASSGDTFLPVPVASILSTANELTSEDFITHQRDGIESDSDTDFDQITCSSSDTDLELDSAISAV